jgi:hypothetical protein
LTGEISSPNTSEDTDAENSENTDNTDTSNFDRFEIAKKLMRCFPNSFINYLGEFIAHEESNQYFSLNDCKNELDVKCKVLAWFSRAAYKTSPFGEKKNKKFHNFMIDGINKFLETNFSQEDMELIYTYLGNDVNRTLTIEFINSGYNMELLQKQVKQ